jgi:hypothetical protein
MLYAMLGSQAVPGHMMHVIATEKCLSGIELRGKASRQLQDGGNTDCVCVCVCMYVPHSFGIFDFERLEG